MTKVVGLVGILFIAYLALMAAASLVSFIYELISHFYIRSSKVWGAVSRKSYRSSFQDSFKGLQLVEELQSNSLQNLKLEKHNRSKRDMILSLYDQASVFEKIWKKEKNQASGSTIREVLNNRLVEIASQTKSDEINGDVNDFLKNLFGKSEGQRSLYLKNLIEDLLTRYRIFEKDKREFEKKKEKSSIKAMSGKEFENLVLRLLTEKGASCKLTPQNGDFGADVIANYADLKVAIQCKRYKDKVGFDAVKEAHTGKDMYQCNMAWVVSNSGYSKAAIEAAKTLKVRLIHIDELLGEGFNFLPSKRFDSRETSEKAVDLSRSFAIKEIRV